MERVLRTPAPPVLVAALLPKAPLFFRDNQLSVDIGALGNSQPAIPDTRKCSTHVGGTHAGSDAKIRSQGPIMLPRGVAP